MTEESEGMLEEFPPDLTSLLAAMRSESMPDVAGSWSKTEDVHHKADELLPILQDLQTLATSAQSAGKNVYIWYSI